MSFEEVVVVVVKSLEPTAQMKGNESSTFELQGKTRTLVQGKEERDCGVNTYVRATTRRQTSVPVHCVSDGISI